MDRRGPGWKKIVPSPQVRQILCNGLPVFQVDRPGLTQAGLIFRVGQADESVTTRGISHLVEHLALSSVDSSLLHNGTVGQTATTFLARGTPDEVAVILRTVCSNLASLPVGRTELESRVLRTEAAQRKAGPPAHLANLRFGYQAYGLSVLREYFLDSPKTDLVQKWSVEKFNKANCAMWVAGELPADMELPLPDGTRSGMSVAPQIPYLSLPAGGTLTRDVVVVDYFSPRTSASTVNAGILAKCLHDDVRLSKGLSYEIGGNREAHSADLAENTIWMTTLTDHAGQGCDAFLSILQRLASAGPTEEELAANLQAYMRSRADPDAAAHSVAYAANAVLEGRAFQTQEELLDERRLVTVESCAEELRSCLNTAIFATPRFIGGRPAWLNQYPSTRSPVSGETYRPVKSKPWGKTKTLVAGPAGISFVPMEGDGATVQWSECVGLVAMKDGRRVVLGRDGFSVSVAPTEWRRGTQLTQVIDRAVDPELHIVPDPA